MTPTVRAPVLLPGVATGIGSLPHTDPRAAAELVLRCLPEMPAAPQLPARDPREGMIAQWVGGAPRGRGRGRRLDDARGVVGRRARMRLRSRQRTAASSRSSTRRRALERAPVTRQGAGHRPAHAGRRAARRRHAGAACVPARRASPRARGPSRSSSSLSDRASRHRARALLRRAGARVVAAGATKLLDRESAIDVLSGALAAVDCVTGVHVCGDGDLGLALEAGPEILGVEVSDDLVRRHGRARRASSTATVGSRGARSPPTARSASRPIRTGGGWPRCGASSRDAAAIRCRCAPAA